MEGNIIRLGPWTTVHTVGGMYALACHLIRYFDKLLFRSETVCVVRYQKDCVGHQIEEAAAEEDLMMPSSCIGRQTCLCLTPNRRVTQPNGGDRNPMK